MKKFEDKIFSEVPTYKELMRPILIILQKLGGSGTVAEINEEVIASLKFTEEVSEKIYEPDSSGQARIKTNLSWARLQGILSFHVVFQCKRYKDSIGSAAIRDFRGAMIGRADKGLFITTGAFTNEALKEATRAGAPP